MSLTTLKPRLKNGSTTRRPVLDAKAGTTERIRGRAWMETRRRVALAHGYRCVNCNRLWLSHKDHIDHTIPLEQGGSNDDSNLKPLCVDCHEAKTKTETNQRFGK